MKKLTILLVLFIVLTVSALALNFTTQPTTLYDYTQMHGLVVANGYVYIVGGNVAADGDSYRIQYAPMSNGTFGTFVGPSSMFMPPPSNDSGAYSLAAYVEFSSLAINSTIYRIGGGWNSSNPAGSNNGDSIWAKQSTDGSLGAWGKLTPFPTGNGTGGIWGAATYAVVGGNTYIYECGGQLDVSALDNRVYRSQVAANGSLGPWSILSSSLMPAATYFDACYAINTNLYVFGGLTTSSSNTGRSNAVFHATINNDGSLSAFDINTTLLPADVTFYGPANAKSKHVLYLIGGRQYFSSAVSLASTYRATISPSGVLSAFTYSGPLVVNSVATVAIHYSPAAIITVNNQERILICGGRYRSPGTATSWGTDSINVMTNSGGVSNGIFLSEPVYTLPSFTVTGPIILHPGQTLNLSVSNGTAPYSNWTSSNAAVGALSGISASSATFTASSTIGTTVVSVGDAYSDPATITINVTATDAPLAIDALKE